MNKDEIGVALIGYGLGGSAFHAPVIATTPGLRLAAIVTGNPERQTSAKEQHPAARVHSTTDDLFADVEGIDVIVISTPNRTHVPLARQAIDAGRAVVVDKPIAPTSAEALQL